MKTRLELHNTLISTTGINNIYYNPPENIKMNYPCIRYKRVDVTSKKADDIKYIVHDRYELVIISSKNNDDIVNKLLSIKYMEYDRSMIINGLFHDYMTIYV